MVFGFISTYPFALLFERGDNVIWGVSFLHVAMDSPNFFPSLGTWTTGMNLWLVTGSCCAASFLCLGLTSLLLPPSTNRS